MKEKHFDTIKLLSCFIVFFFVAVMVQAQTGRTITGKVTDKSGEGLIGASIKIEGSDTGTITDMNGNFTLMNVSPSTTISVAYLGYKTQNISIGNRKSISVILEQNEQELKELVVVGYGVQRKSDLTGAVVSVKAEDALRSVPTSNIESALQGRLAGVSVISGSGDPSSSATIRVRGVNSILADGGPLVVVDGFIGGSLSLINPSDIQSIEVLKDASATAVYGSRGANGVVLVTTKAPKTGKVSVEYNGYVNIKTAYPLPDMLSAGQMAELANAYGKEFNTSAGVPVKQYYTDDQVKEFYKNGGFDYFKALFRNPATENTHELSISGGSEKTKFLLSGRYNYNEGIVQESQRHLVNYRFKLDTEIFKWLRTGVNLNGFYSKSQGPGISGYRNLFIEALTIPNTIPPKDENGNYNNYTFMGQRYNPIGNIWEIKQDGYEYSSTLQGYVEADLLKGLSIRINNSFNFDNSSSLNTNTINSLSGFQNGMSSATTSLGQNYSWSNQNILSYIREFNKFHRINVTAVVEQSYYNNYNNSTTGRDLLSSDIGANNTGLARTVDGSSNRIITTILSYMGRVNYVLLDRYMFTASMRYDGSSNLAPGNKWDKFPSGAVAWNLKQEPFMKNVDLFSQLKLRAGYGITGNQAIGAYSDRTRLTPARSADGSLAISTTSLGNPDLHWERTKQWNGGLDLGFFNNRLTISTDIYNKLTDGALLEVVAPLYTNFSSRLKNAAEISNKGFEVSISADPIVSTDFNWNTTVSLSHNNAVIESLDGDVQYSQLSGGYGNSYFRNIKGKRIATMWGYISDGVWKTSELGNAPAGTLAGSYKFKNIDNDPAGAITTNDQTIIGNGQPKFQWGWNNTLNYKNVDLGLTIIGVHGFDIYNFTREARLQPGQDPLALGPNPEWLKRWTPTNENSEIAGFIKTRNSRTPASQYVEKGDFVKVKSITLGYTLSSQLLKKLNLTTIRVYGSVQNPFLITSYSGMDPEVALKSPLTSGIDYGYYPNDRNYVIGLKLAF